MLANGFVATLHDKKFLGLKKVDGIAVRFFESLLFIFQFFPSYFSLSFIHHFVESGCQDRKKKKSRFEKWIKGSETGPKSFEIILSPNKF
jgi:hypothetical protein